MLISLTIPITCYAKDLRSCVNECVDLLAKEARKLCIEDCYTNTAISKGNDPKICEDLVTKENGTTLNKKQAYWGFVNCVKGVAKNTKDPNLCEKIGEGNVDLGDGTQFDLTSRKYGCITDTAMMAKDNSMCDKIPDQSKQKSCKSLVNAVSK